MSAKVISLAAQHAPSEYAMAERYLDGLLEALRAEVHPRREFVPLSVRQFESRLLAYEIQEALK